MYLTLPDWRATTDRGLALISLLRWLTDEGYEFVTPTPATHATRLSTRPKAITLRDVFGWSLPFERHLLPQSAVSIMEAADILRRTDDGLRSALRVSSRGSDLYFHSAYPTDSTDAVFFGPDSYRFANLIEAELGLLGDLADKHIVDIGTGSGIGAVTAARHCARPILTITDINSSALRLARVNLHCAGYQATSVLSEDLTAVTDPIDLALANPPFIIDAAGRHYRNGGEDHGSAVAMAMVEMALPRLAAGGRLILYTGSAIVDGHDRLKNKLERSASAAGCSFRYSEIDPDIFGEELSRREYQAVDRIAAVSAIFQRGT